MSWVTEQLLNRIRGDKLPMMLKLSLHRLAIIKWWKFIPNLSRLLQQHLSQPINRQARWLTQIASSSIGSINHLASYFSKQTALKKVVTAELEVQTTSLRSSSSLLLLLLRPKRELEGEIAALSPNLYSSSLRLTMRLIRPTSIGRKSSSGAVRSEWGATSPTTWRLFGTMSHKARSTCIRFYSCASITLTTQCTPRRETRLFSTSTLTT